MFHIAYSPLLQFDAFGIFGCCQVWQPWCNCQVLALTNEQFFMFYWNIVKPHLTRVFFCHFCILLQFMTFSVVGVTISLQTPLAQIMAFRHMRLAQVQRKDGFEARLQGVSGRSGREDGQNGPLNLDLSISPLLLKGRSTSLQDRSPNRFEIMLDLLQ